MHIAFVTNKRYPNPRGSSGGLESMREELERRDNRVCVLASMMGKDVKNEKDICRFHVVRFREKRIVCNPWRTRKRLFLAHPDIVHTQQYDGLGRVAREWAIKNGIPWVQTVSDEVSVKKFGGVGETPCAVVVPARALERMLERRGIPQQMISVIPTGVVPEKIDGGNGDLVREEWGIPAEAKVLLSVSRITQEKNSEFLFRSLLPLFRKRKDVYLLCVGGGNLLDSFRDDIVAKGLASRVLFADKVPWEKMKHYYAAGNVFVYASKEDYRATVVAEAMYAGLPIVAVRSGGARERVVDGVSGVLVAEQSDAFLGAVWRLLEDPVRARTLGQGGRFAIETKHTNAKTVDALLKVYESVLK